MSRWPKYKSIYELWNAIKKDTFRTKEGCLQWTRGSSRYPQKYWSGRIWRLNRLSYEVNFGKIPKGMDVCHTCDNRKCFEPTHLFLGTRKENMQDAVRKNRVPSGEKHHLAIFGYDAVKKLVEKFYSAPRDEFYKLADELDIDRSQAYKIIRGRIRRKESQKAKLELFGREDGLIEPRNGRLTKIERQMICAWYSTGEFSQRAVARAFGVDQKTVINCINERKL